MPNQDLDISFDPSSLISKFKELQKAWNDVEKGVTGAGARMDAAVQGFSNSVVKSTSRAEQAQARYVRSIEAQAQAFGKTGVDRLVAQRDSIIKKLGQEEALIKRVTAAYDRMIKIEKTSSGGGSSFPLRYAIFGAKDIAEGRFKYAGAEAVNVLTRVGGTAATIGGITAGVAALGVAALASYKSLGSLGQEIENLKEQTGLSTKEVTQFKFAAEAVGKDVDVFTRGMRGLTQAVEDNSTAGDKARTWLSRFGVDIRGLRDGTVSTADVMKQIATGINALPTQFEKTKAALDLFKRSGIDIIPVLAELNGNLNVAKSHNWGPGDAELNTMKDYHRNLEIISATWSDIVLHVKEFLASGAAALIGGAARNTFGFGTPLTGTFAPREFMAQTAAGLINAPGHVADTAAYNAYLRTQGPQYALSEAERALGQMRRPDQYATAAEINTYTAQQSKVESLKEEVRIKNVLKELDRQIFALEQEAADKAAHPFGLLSTDKSVLEYRRRLESEGIPTGRGQGLLNRFVSSVAPERYNEVLNDLRRAGLTPYASGYGVTNLGRSPAEYGAGLKFDTLLETQQSRAASAQHRLFGVLSREQEAALRGTANATYAQLTSAAKLDEESGLAGVRVSSLLGPQTSSARLAAEQQILSIRKQAADDEFRRDAARAAGAEDAENQLQAVKLKHAEQLAKAEQEYAESYAQIVRQRLDEIKNTAEPLFHTLFTSPNKFGSQLGTTLKNAALKPVESGLSELTARFLYPVIFGGATGGGGGLNDLYKVPLPVTVVNAGGGFGGGYSSGGFSSVGYGTGGGTFGGVGGGGLFDLPMTGPYTSGGGGIFSSLGGLLGGPGGTSGFAGPVGGFGGGTASRGFNLGGLLGGLAHPGNLKDIFFNSGSISTGSGTATTAAGIGGIKGTLAGVATSQAVKGLSGGAGFALAQRGLLGQDRGTGAGVAEGAAGGAMVGFSYGGPIGAAIGAVVGAGIGLGEMLAGVESPRHQAQRLVKEQYGISINNQMADSIVSIADSRYGHMLSIATRSPEVRQMLGLFAAGTGQNGSRALSSMTAHGAGIVESGGRAYQNPVYMYGSAYTYQSSLPVYGGNSGYSLPSPGGGPTQIALSISGNDAANFMTGQYVTPQFVGNQYSAALAGSNGRTQNSMMLNEPGSIVS